MFEVKRWKEGDKVHVDKKEDKDVPKMKWSGGDTSDSGIYWAFNKYTLWRDKNS